jgi:hypothetical protein
MIAVGEGWRIGMNGECKLFVNRVRTGWQMSLLVSKARYTNTVKAYFDITKSNFVWNLHS